MNLATFNRLTATYQEMAYDMACRLLCDPEGAADAVATSVAELYWSSRHLDAGLFRFRLLAGVVHACMEQIRARRPAGSRAPAPFDWDEALESAGASLTLLLPLDEAIEAGLQAMDMEERIVLLLHDHYDCSESETATVTGLAPEIVRKRLCQARIGLRNFLVEHSAFPPVAVHTRDR